VWRHFATSVGEVARPSVPVGCWRGLNGAPNVSCASRIAALGSDSLCPNGRIHIDATTICRRMAENTVVGGDGFETPLTDSLRLIV
jgi:hypothetical protein